uniref:Uncharacterized protein n=1 Tax=Octopus bimaculoides TaxID=37653 RepID=A0A0L8H628_OCTBM
MSFLYPGMLHPYFCILSIAHKFLFLSSFYCLVSGSGFVLSSLTLAILPYYYHPTLLYKCPHGRVLTLLDSSDG